MINIFTSSTEHVGNIYTWNEVFLDIAARVGSRNRAGIFLSLFLLLVKILLFFFSFQTDLLKVLSLLKCKKFSGFGVDTFVFLIKLLWESLVEETNDLAIIEFANYLLYKQR